MLTQWEKNIKAFEAHVIEAETAKIMEMIAQKKWVYQIDEHKILKLVGQHLEKLKLKKLYAEKYRALVLDGYPPNLELIKEKLKTAVLKRLVLTA